MTESSIEMKDVKIESFSIEQPIPSPADAQNTDETGPTAVELEKDEPIEESQLTKCKAFSTLVGGFITMLSCGSIYTLGNISPYITSYYKLDN